MDNAEPHAKRQEARLKFRHDPIQTIFVAEAPPEAPDRFFYFCDVKTHDHLFLGVMEVLYPQEKQLYLNSGRSSEIKKSLLERFQREGYFLMDLIEVPLGLYKGSLEEAVSDLIMRLNEVGALARSIPLILIKANVYEAAYQILKREGFNVVNTDKIPFPSSGQQANFRREIAQTIQQFR